MDTKYSDLELALNTLVTQFHQAAGDGPTMSTTQFQTMVSKQLPVVSKAMEEEDGLGKLLQQMEVQSDQDISFDHFWKLINDQAVQLFGATYREKSTKCSCLLQ
uniref:S100/CaBP-9k-type calcium binding subdomain domain-containing protein n=1 Tax=Salarias fasciatus TaxID=181472 RepID=A0A672G3H0_SALFA